MKQQLLTENTEIEFLEIEHRTWRALTRANVRTIGQLKKLSDKELMKLPRIGRLTVIDIRKGLKASCRTKAPDEQRKKL